MADELSEKTVVLRMNGVGNAFLRELGCTNCPQCTSAKPRANTSASLIVKQGRAIMGHILFDCGLGVVDSLVDFGAPFVTHIFVSHMHNDHVLGLDSLLQGQDRSGGPTPVPVYCTEYTWQEGVERHFGYLAEYSKCTWKPVGATVTPEIPKSIDIPDLGVELHVTPVAVWHGAIAKESVIWVVEFGNGDPGSFKKVVLGWDMLHLIPRYLGEDSDAGRARVPYSGDVLNQGNLGEAHSAVFSDVHDLFLEGNTRYAYPSSGHMSVDAALRFYIPQIEPKRAWIVHYSGHEDLGGPVSDVELQMWIDDEKKRRGIGNTVVRVAEHGMTLVYSL